MNKNLCCKKCGGRDYSFYKTTKKEKEKYFRLCNKCKKAEQIYPDKMAHALYHNFVENKVAEQSKDLQNSPMYFRKLHNIRKRYKAEYDYLYVNLKEFFKYVLSNDLMCKVKNVPIKNIVSVVLKYKEPLREAFYERIINELNI